VGSKIAQGSRACSLYTMMWGLLLLLMGSAPALRRGGLRSDDEHSSLAYLHSLMESMKAGGKAAVDAISFQHLAAKSQHTPGVSANLSEIANTLTEEVVGDIIAHSHLTQAAITQIVQGLTSQVNHTHAQKVKATNSDQSWHDCLAKEKEHMQKVIDKQDIYNVQVQSTTEPCQREEDTSEITRPDSTLEFACDLSKDQGCATALGNFQEKLEAFKSTLSTGVDSDVGGHQRAEGDCKSSKDGMDVVLQDVNKAQADWTDKRGECSSMKTARDNEICSFGSEFQAVCSELGAYHTIQEEALGNGTQHSISDREAEMNATQTVACMLKAFSNEQEVTADLMDSCGKVDLSALQIDLQEHVVQDSLNKDAFPITCIDQSIEFHGQKWDAPGVDVVPAAGLNRYEHKEVSGLPGYQAIVVPTFENKTVGNYTHHSEWKEFFKLGLEGQPFTSCSEVDEGVDDSDTDQEDGDGKNGK